MFGRSETDRTPEDWPADTNDNVAHTGIHTVQPTFIG